MEEYDENFWYVCDMKTYVNSVLNGPEIDLDPESNVQKYSPLDIILSWIYKIQNDDGKLFSFEERKKSIEYEYLLLKNPGYYFDEPSVYDKIKNLDDRELFKMIAKFPRDLFHTCSNYAYRSENIYFYNKYFKSLDED
uniref:Uncharacterized protein n=1 Tax=Pithovirus LCPAC302 TaxID=2506593 RepID=A0A481Z733_9VIRU|nr:MAG: hypothetical protein LCPAC302_00460 [Pithovirus LCPAC302]